MAQSVGRCRLEVCDKWGFNTITTSIRRRIVGYGPRRRVFAYKLICLFLMYPLSVVVGCQVLVRIVVGSVCGCCFVVDCRVFQLVVKC